MSNFEFAVPTLFGLEGIAGDELRRLNMENVRVENGRVLFSGDESAIARANINLRTGERVLIVLAGFVFTTDIVFFLNMGGTFGMLAAMLFVGLDLQLLETTEVEYRCYCSRGRVESTLLSLGESGGAGTDSRGRGALLSPDSSPGDARILGGNVVPPPSPGLRPHLWPRPK